MAANRECQDQIALIRMLIWTITVSIWHKGLFAKLRIKWMITYLPREKIYSRTRKSQIRALLRIFAIRLKKISHICGQGFLWLESSVRRYSFSRHRSHIPNKYICRNYVITTQLAFFINLQRAVRGPSATLTGRERPAIDLYRMLTGIYRRSPALFDTQRRYMTFMSYANSENRDQHAQPYVHPCSLIWAFSEKVPSKHSL